MTEERNEREVRGPEYREPNFREGVKKHVTVTVELWLKQLELNASILQLIASVAADKKPDRDVLAAISRNIHEMTTQVKAITVSQIDVIIGAKIDNE